MDYINDILAKSLEENDTRPFWQFVKSQRQENCVVGRPTAPNCKKAEILNKQFTSIFTSDEDDVHSETTLEGPNIAPIDQIIVSEAGFAKMLCNLDTKKACWPDYLQRHLLKQLAEELSSIYAHIFQCSLDSGELPHVWKTVNVAPIYKKGPVSEAVNYRPFSLTCIPCKLLEHILCSHTRAYLDRHKALTPLNHGFWAKYSCETQLLFTIQDLLEKCDPAKSQTDIAVSDFSKAFDKVPHICLMSKLRLLGIEENISRWIKAFLSGQTQRVCMDGHLSTKADVKSGVPQGTILGPLLFLCFINDLPSVVHADTQVRLFADDCLPKY